MKLVGRVENGPEFRRRFLRGDVSYRGTGARPREFCEEGLRAFHMLPPPNLLCLPDSVPVLPISVNGSTIHPVL